MAEIKIAAESRTEFGKGAARRIRRADKVPAVLYGSGIDPTHITLPGHDLALALKNSNALLSIEVDGDSHLAIPKQVQRDPLKGFIEHADLLIVKKGQKVTVDIRVHLEGDAAPDALVVTENSTISVEAEATHIPESVEVSIEGLEVGSQIHAGDLQLPAGATLAIPEDWLIVNIVAAPTAEEVEAELEEAEAEAGIEHDEPEAEAEGDAGEAKPAEGEGNADEGESESE
ncbi:50S ribosomal protein L25/general stress protein Ctc [Aeromicrobium terrae]|uniref:Large ribosomal subunit protein bL25 n=1 Tax=Aeromicrobium terrae TaxID=2498846 RepID=A0A5C8NCW7_9ACTN|nr:50S ribosomal protein L25/general stress protein Ctc [Aeromicrobium terrae]TXL57352.1 50S ribosomal protein L25/general stress protein Ctc [Aeromicrobium terrae]